MKIRRSLKVVFLISFTLLFCTGVSYFVLDHFFHMHSEFGDVPRPLQIWQLRAHSLAGLWFLFLFGYMYSKHVQPSIRAGKRLVSGYSFLVPIIILCLTVPGLFYLVNEDAKHLVALFHTYLGFALIVPFIAHVVLKSRRFKIPRKNRKRSLA